MVLETKGAHLSGNHDTEYKRALLDKLMDAFAVKVQTPEGLPLPNEDFTTGRRWSFSAM